MQQQGKPKIVVVDEMGIREIDMPSDVDDDFFEALEGVLADALGEPLPEGDKKK